MLSLACQLTAAISPPASSPTQTVHSVSPTLEPAREPFIPTLVDAEVEMPDAQIEYYYISGDTAAELRSDMDNNSLLLSPDGFKGDARTDWYFSWNWPGYGKLNCNLSQATTDYTITVTLPYWEPPASADPVLVARWTSYYNILVQHENGHVSRALDYYNRLLPAIKNASCETADQAAHNVMEALDMESQKYDDATGHGATQGAIFP